MSKTVLFVHGTGVRKASYEQSAARIAHGLKRVAPTAKLESCLWGDELGAKLGLNGASIPEFSGVNAAQPSEDQVQALWELLGHDPLFELRELALRDQRTLVSPAAQGIKVQFLEQLRLLGHDATALGLLEGRASLVQWADATTLVADAPALKAALVAAPNVDTPLRVATARAVVAALQQKLDDENMPTLRRALRDQVVDRCVDHFGGRELGVKDWITSRVVGLGLRWATTRARRNRDSLFSAASPTAGDVLLYQARGAAIRAFIEQRIGDCGDNVAILAHSLGGIACVDVLIECPLPAVKLLVTVGSQAPFLYEIGALSSLPFGTPLPKHFPERWINFFDRNDLLSYCAQRVFGDRAVDYEIASRQPFPQAHSAYWDEPELWQRLKPHLLS
ncbi:hypothetical protein FSO04_06345 [Paraburkholderia madseniana]|uniref:Alpha/beta hydrolase n=1 Tax=Paraburkholderia madseniana TaxID=2599607 RepID=A0A6N6WJL9_9BURK|nr:hypothetical protein [Paraburkholderia madseniana]KAE8760842.1 hypothetical protein FSO04_06345 [Paraburkholderia madseniana]